MKTTINIKTVPQFPCLMRLRDDQKYGEDKQEELIVLFTDQYTGTALTKYSTQWKVGQHSKSWSLSSFEPLNGSITLE